MPSNTPNIIQSLRSAHDPHFKLSGKVGGLENKLTDQVSEIHRTLSKTFVTQRKTLVRVLGLEGRVSELESQQAAEEQAKEGIDDLLGDILGEDTQEEVSESEPEVEVGGTKTKTKPKAKKKPRKKTPVAKKATKPKKKPKIKATKKRIKAENLKKGTVLDDNFKARVMGTDSSGQYLTPEERKRRFKFGDTQPAGVLSAETLQPSSDTEQIGQAEGAKKSIGASPVSDVLTNSLKAIAGSLDNIKSILGDQSKTQQDAQEDARVAGEQDKAKKKEGMLEKVMGPVKKVGEKLLKPFKSILESAFEFLSKIFFGRIAVKLFEWFTNPENLSKVTSIFNFIKDWWPLIVGGILAVIGPGVTFTVGLIALVTWATVKIVDAVKSIFGFGPKIDEELKKGQSDFDKDLKKMDEGDNDVDQIESESNTSTPAEVSEVQDSGQKVTDTSSDIEKPQKMAKGGVVKGKEGVDKVPAMLTAGEFVMTKGAVEKYGVDTLEGLNAAAGGTNKPTLMKQYNEGGTATSMSQEEFVAAAMPGMKMFMEQQNASVDENPEAFNGIKLELDRDGKMPNFGEFIYNQGEAEFNKGLEMVQNNESLDPEIKEAVINKAISVRSQTLDDPNFKGDVAFDINKDIPGTAANRLLMRAQADTTSPAALAGISADDRARQMNRMGYVGGGLVQNMFDGAKNIFNSLPQVKAGKFISSKVRAKIAKTKKNIREIKPPSTPSSAQTIKQNAQRNSTTYSGSDMPAKGIPNFDADLMRSQSKIRVLGLSV